MNDDTWIECEKCGSDDIELTTTGTAAEQIKQGEYGWKTALDVDFGISIPVWDEASVTAIEFRCRECGHSVDAVAHPAGIDFRHIPASIRIARGITSGVELSDLRERAAAKKDAQAVNPGAEDELSDVVVSVAEGGREHGAS